MNRILIVLSVLLIFSGCAGRRMGNSQFTSMIKVESPNGGEFIPYGSTVKISWESQNVSVVNIYVEKLDKRILPVTEIAHFVPMQKAVVAEKGRFTWFNAGMKTGGPGPYVICLVNGTDDKVRDCSDDIFVIQRER